MSLSFLHRSPRPPAVDGSHRPFLSCSPPAAFCIADAYTSVQIYGQTGSGKTTTSARTLALAYLQAGLFGTFLTAKLEDRRFWERAVAAAGRSRDLLDYKASRPRRPRRRRPHLREWVDARPRRPYLVF